MATQSNEPLKTCSDDKCETSPNAPFEKHAHPLGTNANRRPSEDYQDEIEKQKQYFKGGSKP